MAQEDVVTLDQRLAIKEGQGIARYLATDLTVPSGDRTLLIKGVGDVTAMSVWVTEAGSKGESVARGARFETLSVQLDKVKGCCRVVYRHNWKDPVRVGLQIIAG